ncbi:hypothetical protein H0H92_010528 [Tricholoma furcatifolium]|nr:hypothetical protein H0H92_010528 [Tricholoma furcatifolium]
MPVEPSHLAHGVARRTSRKLTNEDEVDVRRARGEPAADAPLFVPMAAFLLGKAQGTLLSLIRSLAKISGRFVLADTTQLHAKIAEMGQRIRQLEDALAIFQSGVSSETHPLLRDELLSIKFGPDKGHALEKEEPPRDNSIDSIDALGTLTIGDHGQVKYFGRSAGSEAGAELDKMASGPDSEPMLEMSSEISQLSNTFPFGGRDSSESVDKSLDLLFGYLPSQPRAWSLCETYMEHGLWAFRPIKRDEIIDEILSPVYKSLKERQATDSPGPHTISPHKLAVLFLVFAIGALVDLTLEPHSSESDTYYHLSRACLSLRSVFESPEITTVQAVSLLAAFHNLGGTSNPTDSSWILLSLSCKLAQSIGLHRDSARFNMDPKTVQRRRILFWELFSTDLFYSLGTGRPPSIRLSYIDCEFPEDDEATLDEDGNTLKGCDYTSLFTSSSFRLIKLLPDYRWKYEFTKEIFSTVTESTLTAEPPHYQTVLDLDRKVREKLLPPHLNVFMSAEDEHCTPSVYMRGCLLAQYRTVALLYIHRSFFAQAMLDHPANPLRSPYAPSFLAAYRCGGVSGHIIIVGTIVTRSPSSSMAPSAFIELGLACDLFEKGASQSRRARSGLVILRKLREKAFQVYSQFRSGNPTTNAVLAVGKPDYGDDELALFGGQTRVLVSKLLNKSSNRKKPSSPTNSGNSAAGSPAAETPDVHPSLVEYLSNIPLEHTAPSSPQQIASPTISYPPQSSFQPNRQYFPLDQQDLQSASWSPSAPFAPVGQSNYLSNPPTFPPPNMPFNALPDYSNFSVKSDTPEPLVHLGMMMTMDEQWMSFMRQSGLLEGNVDNAEILSCGNGGQVGDGLVSKFKGVTQSAHSVHLGTLMAPTKPLNGTDLIHFDAQNTSVGPEVAPSISVSTTFRAPKPLSDAPILPDDLDMRNPSRHIYSRYTQQVSTRAEHILSHKNGYALTYASGLAASYAALVFFKPKRIAIRGGYHGCHATIETYKKAKDSTLQVIDLDDEYQPGDLCWLETPLNPTGEARDIQYYANKVHKVGGSLLVDSTFAPPPLQYPFDFGADCVFHSGTKYFGGHSDLLCGVLVVKDVEQWNVLHHDRTFLGSMMGSLEAWLLLRSLRTLHLRVPRQSETATVLAAWLQAAASTPVGQTFEGIPGGVITRVWHSSLQIKDERGFEPKQQLTGGWNPTFAILLGKPEYATHFCHLLKYFVPATSLGGVESLAEHRLQSDPGADPCLIRLSIGVEEAEDLKADLRQALQQVAKMKAKL